MVTSAMTSTIIACLSALAIAVAIVFTFGSDVAPEGPRGTFRD